jgi:hypothetical protein
MCHVGEAPGALPTRKSSAILQEIDGSGGGRSRDGPAKAHADDVMVVVVREGPVLEEARQQLPEALCVGGPKAAEVLHLVVVGALNAVELVAVGDWTNLLHRRPQQLRTVQEIHAVLLSAKASDEVINLADGSIRSKAG